MTAMTHVELGAGVHALTWGSHGPPVVLVHGLDGSAANWIPVGQELAAGRQPATRGWCRG